MERQQKYDQICEQWATTTMHKKFSHFHTVQSKHLSSKLYWVWFVAVRTARIHTHTPAHLPPIICSSMKVFIFFLLNAHKPPLYDIPSVCHIGVQQSWERWTGAQSQIDATERERYGITCCRFFCVSEDYTNSLLLFLFMLLVFFFFLYWFVCHSMHFVQVTRLLKPFSFFHRQNIVVFILYSRWISIIIVGVVVAFSGICERFTHSWWYQHMFC